MANIVYVSNANTNNYAVGSDSNTYTQAQSKSTPWLTLTHAMQNCNSGDTIVYNNCVFVETGGISSGVRNFILMADPTLSAFGATLQSSNSNAPITLNNVASNGTIISGLVVDQQNACNFGLNTDSSHQLSNITVTGCKFINPKAGGMIRFNDVINGVITNNIVDITGATSGNAGIDIKSGN